ncbi:hypothetical protein BDV96DRAFT_645757 [Lophiotrema nucula]|uniref:Uncharacterized protein n=1 Tax=Lophiotrema nucula TaxID=690887 RepID=A0A6A5ZA95_9PLEO|nr:hypothetical protein BDV96DRAFT_645757 [Lophiotrema nucula]
MEGGGSNRPLAWRYMNQPSASKGLATYENSSGHLAGRYNHPQPNEQYRAAQKAVEDAVKAATEKFKEARQQRLGETSSFTNYGDPFSGLSAFQDPFAPRDGSEQPRRQADHDLETDSIVEPRARARRHGSDFSDGQSSFSRASGHSLFW